jgi:predicted PurR-regulated permease PerM
MFDEGGSKFDSPTSQVTPRTMAVVILTAVAVLGGVYLLWRVREVIVWCALAVFVAVALDPAVNWIQRARIGRMTAIFLAYVGLLLGMTGTIALLVPMLVTQTKSLAHFAVAVSQDPQGWLGHVRDFVTRFSLGWLYDAVVGQLRDVPAQLGQWTESFLLSSRGFLINAAELVTASLAILVISFFLLRDGENFINLAIQRFPETQRARLRRILKQTATAVSGYVTGNLLISLICGVALCVVLIVLKMPYAVVLALIVAVLDLLPQIGATMGGALLVLAGLFVDPWKSIVLLAYVIIYQLVENHILTPAFRRLFLEAPEETYTAGQLQFFGELEGLRDPAAFARYLAPVKKQEWVVYAKPPFGGPQHVLEYLGRYTHRVAISNRRLLALEQGQVSFAWKDYRDQQQPQEVMTVSAEEFIRRFLQHSLPPGFQRIRYYGFLAHCHRTEKLDLCRRLLATPCSQLLPQPAACQNYSAALMAGNPRLCPRCGVGILISIQTLWPCHGPVPLRLDSS